jgi:hypothetical protein
LLLLFSLRGKELFNLALQRSDVFIDAVYDLLRWLDASLIILLESILLLLLLLDDRIVLAIGSIGLSLPVGNINLAVRLLRHWVVCQLFGAIEKLFASFSRCLLSLRSTQTHLLQKRSVAESLTLSFHTIQI